MHEHRRSTRPRVLALGLGALLGVTLGLAPYASASVADHARSHTVIGGDTVPVVKALGPTSFTRRGPYAVGEATSTLPEIGSAVEIWYPARRSDVAGRRKAAYDLIDWLPSSLQSLIPAGVAVTYPSGGVRGVPVAPGRFPLVVFSHGFAGFRDQSSFLTSWLASWGFVVAAPDHRSRDLTAVLSGTAGTGPANADLADLRGTLRLMRAKDRTGHGRFRGHVDTTRVGALGHSAGGAAVEAWAASDRRVTTFIGMAGATVGAFGQTAGGPRSIVPKQPGLLLAGTSDGVVDSASMVAAYDKLRRPKRLVLVGGGHHAFSDLCEIGASSGGILAIADLLHVTVPAALVPLASDGCSPPALAPTLAWPAIRQVVVAQLRHVFRFDRSGAALRGLRAAFPGVVAQTRVVR